MHPFLKKNISKKVYIPLFALLIIPLLASFGVLSVFIYDPILIKLDPLFEAIYDGMELILPFYEHVVLLFFFFFGILLAIGIWYSRTKSWRAMLHAMIVALYVCSIIVFLLQASSWEMWLSGSWDEFPITSGQSALLEYIKSIYKTGIATIFFILYTKTVKKRIL